MENLDHGQLAAVLHGTSHEEREILVGLSRPNMAARFFTTLKPDRTRARVAGLSKRPMDLTTSPRQRQCHQASGLHSVEPRFPQNNTRHSDILR